MNWAHHKKAHYYLMLISFIEAIFLPFPPPDALLMPIVLKQMHRAYQLAMLTTIFSVLGGIVGFALGYYAYNFLLTYLQSWGYVDNISLLKSWFDIYGIWVIALAGFSPVPYKLFTITAGFLQMNLLLFVIISLLSRGARFYLITLLVSKFGPSCDKWLQNYIDYLGYILVVLFVIYYLIYA